ncbi:MAG TPA: hypothetical protein VGM50_23020 [Gemmatimonadaceae bacterium]|jgi:hypothetical protein
MSTVVIDALSNPAAAFTPLLTFGGGATGLTFANHSGYYIKIGSLVWFKLDIGLSAKGSSTGAAVITGLPFTADTLSTMHCAITIGFASGFSSVAGGYTAIVAQGTTNIAVYQNATGTNAQLTDANFTNASRIIVSGWYSI